MLGVFSGGVSRVIYGSTYVGIVLIPYFWNEHLQNHRNYDHYISAVWYLPNISP